MLKAGLHHLCGAELGKAFEGIRKVSTSAFGDTSFYVRLASFGQRHTDKWFRVSLKDSQIGCRILPVTAHIEDVSK